MPEIVLTADGSHSLYNLELNEHYHSKYGALQESKFIYINKGLQYVLESHTEKLDILEMGFGTGMNCYLTFLADIKLNIHYTAIDILPLPPSIFNQLNYPLVTETLQYTDIFQKMHECEWEKEIKISGNFSIVKFQKSLLEFQTNQKFDLIYFDAFGPSAQPELWSLNVFEKIKSLMNFGGVLVTYCSKGDVRRTMMTVGLHVTKLPGPPGKREILRAIYCN
jgi:tRNA U34 5-methylaminomethyl-2-thiouridine-forming methyltransferase MnmC